MLLLRGIFERELSQMLEPKNGEPYLLNPVRVETAFSRYPIHKLVKQKNVFIEIQERDGNGQVSAKWEVSYNSKHGQPGQLAYKVDSLVINRRIDEKARPIPSVIKLGSLRDIASETGTNVANTNAVKKALFQNAAAFINASVKYIGSDKEEYLIEFAGTRYNIILTGKKLPNGAKADAVYIVLHDLYRELLNRAQRRPLDYDYLKELAPAPQRFYELLSFQMFAALKNERPRARLLYSEYCTHAPQSRYFDYDHVKKQMFKVHAPHRKVEYIAAVELRQTTDTEGRADWEMLYTPGRKAKAEYRAFNEPGRTLGRKRKPPEQLALPAPTAPPPLAQSAHEAEPQELDPLVTKLTSFHITGATARELVTDYRKSVELQLRALPYRNLNKIKDLAAWLIVAIKENHQLPEAITEAQVKEEEVRKAQAKKEAHEARQRDEEARRAAYFDFLRVRAGQTENEQPETYKAFLADTATKRAELETDPTSKGQAKKILLRVFDDEQSQLERFRDYFNEPSFEEWESRQS
jgi:hypothetical protein